MNLLKKILWAVGGIIALLLLIAAFMPKAFKTEASVVIDRPQQDVYDYVKYIKNQDNFGKWNLMDPGMAKFYEGTDGEEGFKYRWESKEVGNGTQTLVRLVPGQEVHTVLDFGFGDPAKSHMLLVPVSDTQTKITWGISGDAPWPMNIMSLFVDMSDDFEEGLLNLKQVLEK